MAGLTFLWLEITGRCQLKCAHCYADSGPTGTQGSMTTADWRRVIDQAAAIGVRVVQFNGGEPTLHPDLPALVRHALGLGLLVEIFSNLVRVPPGLWELFSLPGVSLATSYYSDDPAEHAAITGRRDSYGRTRANLVEAVRRGVPVRAGVVDLGSGQRWQQAVGELESLGVTDIRTDSVREIGRGAGGSRPCLDQLCGNCAREVLAIGPDGTARPCVFARWKEMAVGNVRRSSLADIMSGTAVAALRRRIWAATEARQRRAVRGEVKARRSLRRRGTRR
ncbi:MAG TPA: radical SAM protein [Gemmatimonadales bacterium]|nr:radical SAM protein [Gemmatimonadales bacterium]